MKLFTTLAALLCISLPIVAQEISRDLLTTAGDFSKNQNGISLSWSIGDTFCQTTLGDQHLTEGFQQGHFSNSENLENVDSSAYRIGGTAIATAEELKIEVTAFPNPTTDYLTLHFQTATPQNIVAYVFDEKGNLLLQKNIKAEDDQEIELSQIENLSAGKYFVEFVKNGKILFTKPFLKINS